MNLSPSQLLTLKANINANSATLSQAIAQRDGPTIAAFYNALAAGPFIVWKSLVSLPLVGMAFDFNAVSGLTTADSTRLQLMFQVSPQGINPYLQDRRDAFNSIFSAVSGATTRAALLVLWKRSATVGEKLFATGTGSDAAPATLGITTGTTGTTFAEGLISDQNVLNALDA